MKLFKKGSQLTAGQEGISRKLAGDLLMRQRRLADRLNRHTAGFSLRAWLWLLVVFCAGFGGYCLWLVIGAFY
ncbi:hypothetical protein [Pedobacter deserti]|uniref:hypothetical protein n=1 Tax=Pedobacter deserti TaxID=2817382 RepID=UPI00210EEC93|nr:hypothetical protein [Pedobacter sp. SYSU D00382]